jgi:hypothetical protein
MTRVSRLSHLHPAGVGAALGSSPEGRPGCHARCRTDAAAPLLAPPGRGALLYACDRRADSLQELAHGDQEAQDA